ncbi:MAG: AI-2E family transporter [Saprospiraceae bacterium]|nr:AI-2E family transporter [Saprospiraceae bacterium]
MPKGLAVIICFLSLILLIAGIGFIIGLQLYGLTEDFDQIEKTFTKGFKRFQQYIVRYVGVTVKEQEELMHNQEPMIYDLIKSMVGSLPKIITNFILIIIYVPFLLFYRNHIKTFILKLADPAHETDMENVINRVAAVSQNYLVGLLKMIFCLWIMYGIGFSLLGVENAILFAILCGVLEIVPFIGNLTGTFITVMVTAVQGGSMMLIFGIVLVYGIVQMIQGWLLEPFIVGSQVKINPLFTILALLIGSLLWGIPGIFLAIPLMAMFKIVCDHVEPLKPYGFLIGETVKEEKK